MYYNKVHPGQIAFFEFKYSQYGKSLLATTNGDLQEIYLWDIYNRPVSEDFDFRNPNEPDMTFLTPKNYEIENMRWRDTNYEILASMKNEDDDKDNILSIYTVPSTETSINKFTEQMADDGSRLLKPKKSTKNNYPTKSIKLPINISYFCTNNENENIIYATSGSTKFSLDTRNPKNYSVFDHSDSKENSHSDVMVEYSQNNYLLFADRLKKSITVSDIRQVN